MSVTDSLSIRDAQTEINATEVRARLHPSIRSSFFYAPFDKRLTADELRDAVFVGDPGLFIRDLVQHARKQADDVA